MKTKIETPKKNMIQSYGYAAQDANLKLAPFSFTRRDLLPNDILIDILYCGICHSDLHQVKNEWGGSSFPMVPGHEIVGKISKIGTNVKRFSVGEIAGVGCMVDSCRTCTSCKEKEEQYCEKGCTWSYGSSEKHHGGMTYGGYSNNIVVDSDFALKISKKLDLAAAAPLLCAGITTYSPLKHWKVGSKQKVGIYGLGGLGHMGLKFASAFGAEVVQFTTSPNKIDDAKRMGASEVVISNRPEEMKRQENSFNLILDTVSADHDINQMLSLLKKDGTLVIVGVPTDAYKVHAFSLIRSRRSFSGSLIGGIKETQEMLDFCAEKNIVSDVEIIPIQKVNEAYVRMLKSDVRYRFVIDMKTL